MTAPSSRVIPRSLESNRVLEIWSPSIKSATGTNTKSAIGAKIVGISGSIQITFLLLILSLPRVTLGEAIAQNEEALQIWSQLKNTIIAEEVLLELQAKAESLEGAIENLELPGTEKQTRLFTDEITVIDTEDSPSPVNSPRGDSLSINQDLWKPLHQVSVVTRSKLSIWKSCLDEFELISEAKIKLRSINLDIPRERILTPFTINAHGLATDRSRLSLRGKGVLEWTKVPAQTEKWLISDFRTESVQVTRVSKTLFSNVTDRVLPDYQTWQKAINSIHENYATDLISDPVQFKPPYPEFTLVSHDRHPGVSIVDINNDGWEDLFLVARHGSNLLLRNETNGTFRNIATELGLAGISNCSCSIFFDIDNDGDLDVFLGRTLKPSILLENSSGSFKPLSHGIDALPKNVSSALAADFDNNGLIDLYISTYAYSNPSNETPTPAALELIQKRGSHPIHNVSGPSNKLYFNEGNGRWTDKTTVTTAVYRHTYQSVSADFDQDGDVDIYVVNDYAPNEFLVNDGSGHFEPATAETGTADVGFGMGACWGDYNLDGHEDLYVSNMYSTAGNRIIENLPLQSGNYLKMARGNTLFKNLGNRFVAVSGKGRDSIHVEKTGWSWASQFVDIDNNTWPDLAVLNGYFTAPEAVALPVDT